MTSTETTIVTETMSSAEILCSGGNRMMPAEDAFRMAESILALQALLTPIAVEALKASKTIARVDADAIVAEDCDLGALAAAEALHSRLNQARSALDAAAAVFSAGRNESGLEMLSRLGKAALA
jgi:hypothetical protein